MSSGVDSAAVQRSIEFRAVPSRDQQVRRIVAAYLRYWGLAQLAEAASHGAAELLAARPADRGADEPCAVALVCASDRLTVSVRDGDPRRGLAAQQPRTCGFPLPTERTDGARVSSALT